MHDRGTAALGTIQLDLIGTREADAVDFCSCALKNGSLLIDLDPHPDELWAIGKKRNLGYLTNWNARETDVRAFVDSSTAGK